MRDGVLFVATGAGYRALARRAAARSPASRPGLPIDPGPTRRSRPGASPTCTCSRTSGSARASTRWPRTRFERTLHLDADVLAVADLRDVFEVLDRFDIALAHDQARNSPAANTVWRRALPERLPAVQRRRHRLPRTPGGPRLPAALGRRPARERHEQRPAGLRELLWEATCASPPCRRNTTSSTRAHRAAGTASDRPAPRPPLPLPQALHRRPPRGRDRRRPARPDDRRPPADDPRRRPPLAAPARRRAARADPGRPRERLPPRPRRPPRRAAPAPPSPSAASARDDRGPASPGVTCADADYFHFLPTWRRTSPASSAACR